MNKRQRDLRCLVAPHPELLKKMRADLKKAGGKGALASRLKIMDSKPVGMDDGLIYPGDYFPLGTSAHVARSAAADRAPLRGSVRIVVVLVDFSDKKMTQTKKHYEDLFFSSGVLPNGSVRDYYKEASNGLIDIIGEVVGPFRMPKKLADYAKNKNGTEAPEPNARTMARSAAEAANPTVDFSKYDNDGDGFVDAFIVIHAGKGAEVTGSAGDIWSHKWVFSGGAYSADGAKIYAYLTVPEDSRIGVCCHELGHLLFGWPDLYDTDYSSAGLGNWCLMAGGSWNGGGDIPAHPSAWCKADQGWVSVINQTTNQNVTIPDVKTGHSVYRLWKDGAPGKEYFLLENRQLTQYDKKLPAGGLFVYHVDDAISSNANEAHPKIALLQADGLKQLESGVNRGDTGDPFPGSSNKTTLNSTSTPNTKSYGGVNTCVAVTNIGAVGASMSVRLTVKCKVKEAKEKEHKESLKEHLKEKEHFKEKDHKESIKEHIKEVEKPLFDKQLEKPITDKSQGFDKSPAEKFADKFNEGGGGGFGFVPALASMEARIAGIEAAIQGLQPFIGKELRPDLRTGALGAEPEYEEMNARMREGAVGAKRSYDTKPKES